MEAIEDAYLFPKTCLYAHLEIKLKVVVELAANLRITRRYMGTVAIADAKAHHLALRNDVP